MQKQVISELKEYCQFFGYFHPDASKGEEHAYSKFDFPSNLSLPQSKYCQYKIENEKTLAWNQTL